MQNKKQNKKKRKRDAPEYAKISVRLAWSPTSFVSNLESASISNLDAVFSFPSFFSLKLFLYCPSAASVFYEKIKTRWLMAPHWYATFELKFKYLLADSWPTSTVFCFFFYSLRCHLNIYYVIQKSFGADPVVFVSIFRIITNVIIFLLL